MMNKPIHPPTYSIIEVRDGDIAVLLAGAFVELPESEASHGYDPDHGRLYPTHETAVEACWAHWREHGDPAWVAYLDSLPAEQREPFTGFDDISDEQQAIAQAEAERLADTFAAAKMLPPTADDVIFAAHLQTFAADAQDEPGSKSSKLVHAVFDARTRQGQASSVMLAQLLKRLYASPYPGLNVAGFDFVNVFVAVITVAFSGLKNTPKFGSKAKGKRPS